MDLLLYFGSYSAVLTLFASGTIAMVWLACSVLRAVAGFIGLLINPRREEDITKRLPPHDQLLYLKRAGQ